MLVGPYVKHEITFSRYACYVGGEPREWITLVIINPAGKRVVGRSWQYSGGRLPQAAAQMAKFRTDLLEAQL
jgi:hypothetical protein